MKKRANGILLHITSLPSKYGIGDFGPEAYKFADFLVRSKQSYWQILPLNTPILNDRLHSPYNSLSAFAGNRLLISPELLYRESFLSKKDIADSPVFPEKHVDYRSVISYKTKLLNKAFKNFQKIRRKKKYEEFCLKNESWLEDYTTFIALRRHFGYELWCNWPIEFRDKRKHAVKSITPQLREIIEQEKFLQYQFFRQWFSLKSYCNKNGVEMIGDIPIYVGYDSADVWGHPEIFKLTRTKKPKFISGVPPDFFSHTGQLWGNPIYNWQALKKTDYNWWIERFKHNLNLFDIVRLDHFRGFIGYWQIPAEHKTAEHGKWMPGPKEDFFNKILKHFPNIPIIVEDLGHITADVIALIDKFGFPRMKVLLLAFDGNIAANLHCPYNHTNNCVVYTGTHDNNTVKGWFTKEAKFKQKKNLFNYLGHKVGANKVHWEFARMAMSSVGRLVIIPMQDVLGLDEHARMNRPATAKGNWIWRVSSKQMNESLAQKLADLTKLYGRV